MPGKLLWSRQVGPLEPDGPPCMICGHPERCHAQRTGACRAHASCTCTHFRDGRPTIEVRVYACLDDEVGTCVGEIAQQLDLSVRQVTIALQRLKRKKKAQCGYGTLGWSWGTGTW